MARKVSLKIAEKMKAKDWDWEDTYWSCKNRKIKERRILKKKQKENSKKNNKRSSKKSKRKFRL